VDDLAGQLVEFRLAGERQDDDEVAECGWRGCDHPGMITGRFLKERLYRIPWIDAEGPDDGLFVQVLVICKPRSDD